MRDRIISLLGIVSTFGILLMLNYTSPRNVGVFGVLVFFTMIFMALFWLMSIVVKVFQRILKDKNGRGKDISRNKTYMYATVLAFGPIILLVTRSMGLMTLALTAIFVSLGCFLIYKRA